MDVSKVRRIIAEMKEKDFDFDEKGLEDSAKPNTLAADEMIEKSEKELNIKYPETYKTFLKEYSNGNIVLFGIEPLVSLGLDASECLCDARTSDRLLHLKDEPDKKCYIFPEIRYIKQGQLIAFTFYDGYEISNSHWAFICDKEYPDNDYPVGYISADTGNIVCVLDSFETWLDVFWQGNKNRRGYYTNVIMLLYPDYDDLCDLRDNTVSPGAYPLYKMLREKNDINFKRYGIK